MSIHQLSWGATALGGLLMGGLAEWQGVAAAIGFGGLVVTVASVVVGVAGLRRVLVAGGTPQYGSIRSGR